MQTVSVYSISKKLLNTANRKKVDLVDKYKFLLDYIELEKNQILPLGITADGRYVGKDISFGKKSNDHVMITGQSGEGKTFCATNLLPTLAMLGSRMLVCDVSDSFTRDEVLRALPEEVVNALFEFIDIGGGQRKLPVNPLYIGDCKNLPAKKRRIMGFIEAVSILAMAVPGTVLGVGYIRGFAGGLFHSGFMSGIYGTGLILVIVFIVRSLPTGTRSGISALRQIDKSIEESAYDMGANSLKVFTSVTLPLIKDSFLSGLVTAFVRSITAISAIILLVTPSYLLITVQINEFAEKGAFSIACAFATILILITYGAVLLMNLFIRFFGTSRTQREET